MAGKKSNKALVPAETVLEGEILPPETVTVEAPVGPTAEEHKATESSIRAKIAHYLEGKQSAHLAVIEGVMWAAKHGDAKYINLAFDLLGGFEERPSADADRLRMWCGKVTSFTNAQGKVQTWLGFNQKASDTKKAGFYVKSGLEPFAARLAMNETDLKQGPRFMDTQNKSPKPYGLEELLKAIAKFSDTVNSKEKKVVEAGSVPLPESLKRKLLEASAEATLMSAHIPTVEKAA